MKVKLRRIILQLLLGVAIILLLFVPYTRYMNRQVRNESAQHLEELFLQVNNTFSNVVSRTWNILHGWEMPIQEKSGDQKGQGQLEAYMEEQKEAWDFIDVYFLDKNGNYMTLSGENGYFDLGDSLFSLMNEDMDIVVNNTLSTGEPIFLFAVPINEGRLGDFTYRSVGVSFHQNTLMNLLKINAFDNQANCFVISPNGAIAMSGLEKKEKITYNFFAYLENNARFRHGTLDSFRSDIRNKKMGMVEFYEDGVDYYLSYLPVGLENWTMLGLVPKDAVNANTNSLRMVTTAVIGALFLGLSVVVIFSLMRRNRDLIHGKDVELKYREQLFNLLITNVDDIFVMYSPGAVSAEYVSPNVERLLGLSQKQVQADVLKLECAVLGDTLLFSDLGELPIGESRRQDGYMRNLSTGERRWYCAVMYHEMVEGSEKYILILSDRTDEKKNDERLGQALDVARNANAAKSTFLSNMSHDIRTPLNGIVGMTVIAQANLDNRAKIEDCLNKISFSSKHLLGLINDILDMSKIESGKMTLNYERFSIEQLVEGIMEIIQPQTVAKKQTLETSIQVKNHELLGDTLRLNQVLLNLLSNAVKYTQEGGKILFSAEERERTSANYVGFRFTVEDNGRGMTEDYIKTLFDPFSREKSAEVSKIQGTGLGMSICKGIVELLGGIIQVESVPGEGSTFTVDLSLRIEKETLVIQESAKAGEYGNFDYHNKHFLVAEDNELNAEIICQLLAMEGADAVLAGNGREAVEIFKQSGEQCYDAVLMDVQMPVMNGYDSTRAIRGLDRPDARRIPIIAMTADAFAEDIQKAKEAGMNAHVAKPIDMKLLSEALREVVGEREDTIV